MRLLISPDGMLGQAFIKALQERGLAFRSIGEPDLDLTNSASVDEAIASDIELVINCAAYTNVDGAEENEAVATAVNGDGVRNLATRCKAVGAKLVHYSTDYVFEGDASAPYRTDHPRAPLNAYGRSKAVGEEALENAGIDHLLIRTSWLYAPWGNNFVLTMAKLGREREALKVVDDQRGRPTSAEHLARTTLALLDAGASGSFHVTDGGECTWWEFAKYVVAKVSDRCVVSPCSTAEFPRPAKRPAYSVLDLSKTEELVGPMGPWESHVDAVMASSGIG